MKLACSTDDAFADREKVYYCGVLSLVDKNVMKEEKWQRICLEFRK